MKKSPRPFENSRNPKKLPVRPAGFPVSFPARPHREFAQNHCGSCMKPDVNRLIAVDFKNSLPNSLPQGIHRPAV
jgi:hypothetical protein